VHEQLNVKDTATKIIQGKNEVVKPDMTYDKQAETAKIGF